MAEFSPSEQTRALITAAAFDDFEASGAIAEEVITADASSMGQVVLELALIAARALRKVAELGGIDYDKSLAAFMSARSSAMAEMP